MAIGASARPLLALLALVGAALALVATTANSSSKAALKCGKERWAVKTLTDPDRAAVDLDHPKTSLSVEGLRRLKVPAKWSTTAPRLAPVETSTYRVKALLMSMIREDDSDIHLVIADPKVGGSMIVEFPAGACTVGASAHARSLMASARAAVGSACGGEPGTKVVTLSGSATITGVGFFDRIHGQGGVAPNGIELHPVTAFANAVCKRR